MIPRSDTCTRAHILSFDIEVKRGSAWRGAHHRLINSRKSEIRRLFQKSRNTQLLRPRLSLPDRSPSNERNDITVPRGGTSSLLHPHRSHLRDLRTNTSATSLAAVLICGDREVNIIQHRHAYLMSFKPVPRARRHDVRIIGAGRGASPRRIARVVPLLPLRLPDRRAGRFDVRARA